MRKQVKCPCCKRRLIDEGKNTVTETKIAISNKEMQADYYIKCNVCKKEIAIKKIR